MMNAKLKAKWVKALRSGKYKQTRGQLMSRDQKNKPTYCCLGVLERVSGVSVKELERKIQNWEESENDDAVGLACIPGKSHLGLSYNMREKLAKMNDLEDLSFAEIADHIETSKRI